jgi:fermentation-respiration switch protein FrsA (DUF1100 family)
MKKIIFILILMHTLAAGSAQEITGDWYGVLKISGMQMRLTFHITKNGEAYKSTMDSPDQKAFGVPVTTTTFSNSVLFIDIPAIGFQYNGKLEEGKISGMLKQGGQQLPLNLGKEIIAKQEYVRPQMPVKPYPYYTEDVKFRNEKDNINLAGTLSMPKQEGSFPAVILISGSGPQNRDEELLGHKPFLVLSDYLTKIGYAVLRYDDRGTAQSEGSFKNATTFDFANDALAAVDYLKKRKEINKKQIGLMGHSEGGLIAPIVAAKTNDVSFIVLLAGPGIQGSRILLLQQELIGRASGISEEELVKAKDVNKKMFDIILNSKDIESANKELVPYLKQVGKDNPGKRENKSEDELVENSLKQLTNPWMYNFIKYDPTATLKKVKCPALCLNGEKDLQVPPKENLSALKTNLESNGNKKVTVKELAGLNHLFQECKTGAPSEYAEIEQTFSPSALKEISDWLKANVK